MNDNDEQARYDQFPPSALRWRPKRKDWQADFRAFGAVMADPEPRRPTIRDPETGIALRGDPQLNPKLAGRVADIYEAMLAGLQGRWSMAEEALPLDLDDDNALLEIMPEDPTLGQAAEAYLEHAAQELAEGTINRYRKAIDATLRLIPRRTRLRKIKTKHVLAYVTSRREVVKPSTIRQELVVLSRIYKLAILAGVADANPVAIVPRPKLQQDEARYLEPKEAGAVLAWARLRDEHPAPRAIPFALALLAALLYAGLRISEAFGLLVDDIDLDAGIIDLTANEFRGLKRSWHARRLKIWPALMPILRGHIEFADEPTPEQSVVDNLNVNAKKRKQLLFPSPCDPNQMTMLTDIRGTLFGCLVDACVAQWEDEKKTKITPKLGGHTLRHTFTAARLQTMDAGEPVAPFTVMRELGHRDLSQITQRYGHILENPIRMAELHYPEPEIELLDDESAA